MSKCVKDIEVDLIKSLNSYLPEGGRIKTTERFIYLTEEEFNSVSKSKSSEPINVSGIRFVTLNINDQNFIAVLGIDNCKNNNPDIESYNLDVSLFMAISNILIPKIVKSPAEIRERLYNEEEKSSNFVGYKFEELKPLYEGISIFKIQFDYNIYNQTISTIAGIVCDNKGFLALPLSDDTINSYRDLCFQQYTCVENLISSMTSYNWHYAFLDVYRCIEPLFDKPIVYEMFDKWKINKGQFNDLHNFIRDRFHWTRNEKDAMDSLFSNLPEQYKQNYNGLDVINGNLGYKIYDLRNKIVHFQDHQNDLENTYTIEKWNKLIKALLESLKYFYTYYVD